jgi:hypothetical protein
MPDSIHGTHLRLSNLAYNGIVKKLNDVGEWTSKLDKDNDFQRQTTEVHKCTHPDREQKLQPILDALGYTRQVCDL